MINNEDLVKKLAVSKSIQEKLSNRAPISQKAKQEECQMISTDISVLDNAVFGEPVQTGTYDPQEEMEKIKERIRKNETPKFSSSKIPSAILESIKENPLDVEPMTDKKMEDFTKKLADRPSIMRSLSIQKKLDETKGESMTNVGIQRSSASVVDYEMIKMIVENSVKKEISTLSKKMINEGSSGTSQIKALKMTDKGKFIFLDKDGNLYECTMRYIGKNRRKKTQQ